MDSHKSTSAHLRTAAVRAGIGSEQQHGAVVPPLHLSATYTFAGFNQKRTYDYSRSANPTRDVLASALAELEGAAGGVVTATGMAAVLLTTTLLRPGELLLAPHDCYGGSYRLFETLRDKGHFDLQFVDMTDAASLQKALERRPRLLWIETPSNPLLRITDVRRACELAHAVGATVAVDNTFLSPALQRPLALGADLVVHSTTKYLNGHSDIVGGAVLSADRAMHDELVATANTLGLTGSPFDSYMTLRGLRTLFARLALQQQNALALVALLRAHPAVARVYHPSLPEHPGHEIAKAQQQGFGAMLSFELRGDTRNVEAFVADLRHLSLAESLGGVESLVAHPPTMTHAAMSPEARHRAGIADTLLRISVGMEATEDLVDDVQRALDRAQQIG